MLGQLNRDYASFQQQDSHDLLAFVLDRLHEDVNLVGKKPYTETSEVVTLDDVDRVGAENWAKHLLRHDSAVQDVVGGFLKSQIVCPLLGECGKVSVTFDYTSTVQLAIPQPKRDRGRRDRSGSMGSACSGRSRSRTRTVSGHTQYLDLLVSNGRGRSSSVDAVELSICFMPQAPPGLAGSGRGGGGGGGGMGGAVPKHKGVLALSALSFLPTQSPIEVTVRAAASTTLWIIMLLISHTLTLPLPLDVLCVLPASCLVLCRWRRSSAPNSSP